MHFLFLAKTNAQMQMKQLIVCLFTVYCTSQAMAQDAKVIFNAEKIVFYGLDFSKAKFAITDAKPAEIRDVYFNKWNEVVITDNGRFPKESAFQKVSVYCDPTVTNKRNAAVSVANITGKPEQGITKEAIQQVISEYDGGMKKEGLGVVFVVESFDKKKEEAVAHIAFFDIATKKLLLTKRLTGKPGGGGLTNYWTRCFQQMFEDITNKQFMLWKKEVMG